MKSILLIGLGRFGKHMALQLNQLGHQVMGVDHNEDRVNDAMDAITTHRLVTPRTRSFFVLLVLIVTMFVSWQSETTFRVLWKRQVH